MAENSGQYNKGIESQVKTVYRYNSKCTLNSNIPFVDYQQNPPKIQTVTTTYIISGFY